MFGKGHIIQQYFFPKGERIKKTHLCFTSCRATVYNEVSKGRPQVSKQDGTHARTN